MLPGNCARIAISRALSPVVRALEGKLLQYANQTVIEGLPVFVQTDLVDGPTLTTKMASAFHLLAVFDAGRWARVRHDLSKIFVNQAVGPVFWRGTRACVLPARLVRISPPEWIAAMVVHEATNARLGWRRGRRSDPILAVQTCCVRAQMAFLRKLPLAEFPRRDEFLDYLSQATSKPWWTKSARMLRHRRVLAESGAPEWFQYLLTGGVGVKEPPKN